MKTMTGWANKVEMLLVPANNTEELQISCSASNSAGELTETTRVEVTGKYAQSVRVRLGLSLIGRDHDVAMPAL